MAAALWWTNKPEVARDAMYMTNRIMLLDHQQAAMPQHLRYQLSYYDSPGPVAYGRHGEHLYRTAVEAWVSVEPPLRRLVADSYATCPAQARHDATQAALRELGMSGAMYAEKPPAHRVTPAPRFHAATLGPASPARSGKANIVPNVSCESPATPTRVTETEPTTPETLAATDDYDETDGEEGRKPRGRGCRGGVKQQERKRRAEELKQQRSIRERMARYFADQIASWYSSGSGPPPAAVAMDVPCPSHPWWAPSYQPSRGCLTPTSILPHAEPATPEKAPPKKEEPPVTSMFFHPSLEAHKQCFGGPSPPRSPPVHGRHADFVTDDDDEEDEYEDEDVECDGEIESARQRTRSPSAPARRSRARPSPSPRLA